MDPKWMISVLLVLAGYLVREFRASPSPIIGIGAGVGVGVGVHPLLLKKGLIGAAIAKPLLIKKGLIGAGLIAKPLLIKKGLLAAGGALAAKKVLLGKGKVALGAKKVVGGKTLLGKGKVAFAKPVFFKKFGLGKLAAVPSVNVQSGKQVSVYHGLPSSQAELVETVPAMYPVPEPVVIPAAPIEAMVPVPEMFPVPEPVAIEMVAPVPAPVVEIGKTVEIGKSLGVSL